MLHVPLRLGDVTLVAWGGGVDAAAAARTVLPDGWELSMSDDKAAVETAHGSTVMDMFAQRRAKRLRVHGPFDVRRCLGAFADFTPKGLGAFLSRLEPCADDVVICLATFDSPAQIRQTGWTGTLERARVPTARKRASKNEPRGARARLGSADLRTHDYVRSREIPVAHREALGCVLCNLETRGVSLPQLLRGSSSITAGAPPSEDPIWTREEKDNEKT